MFSLFSMLGERNLTTASGARARGEVVARSEEAVGMLRRRVGAVDVFIFISTARKGKE